MKTSELLKILKQYGVYKIRKAETTHNIKAPLQAKPFR